MDRDKLAKLLAMTTSENDGEALNAMRMANKIVKDAGKTWQDALAQAVVSETHITLRPGQGWSNAPSEDWGRLAPHLTDRVVIDMMFRAVYSQPRTDNEEFWQFMDSIHAHFQKHKSLTQGQYRALQNCYQRALRSSRQG